MPRLSPQDSTDVTGSAAAGLFKAALAAVAALLQMQAAFLNLLVFAVVLDLMTSGWDRGRWLGLSRLPRRVYTDWLKRVGENVVIVLVLVSLANVFPALLGYLVEFSVLYAAVRHGSGSIDHVLSPGHAFRRTWARIVGRIERLWDLDDDERPDDPPRPSSRLDLDTGSVHGSDPAGSDPGGAP